MGGLEGPPKPPALVGRLDATGAAGAVSADTSGRTPMKKDITSLRSTLEYLDTVGELVTTDVEVDPHLEVAAIQKHFDGGAALLFNKVKGYPNARICNNIFASAARIARLLDVDDPKNLKHKVVEALRDPLPPVEVRDGPCQEVVLTKSFDVWDVVPMISHSDSDPGRTLGAGTTATSATTA
ncbi:MAG: hypothetical protein DME05_04125 [Candidatus Rokuibacteriota bacterium]|nr:MAG: hypothetical protein DME05_04125 [Candidatus Rokubacteria bacterium]